MKLNNLRNKLLFVLMPVIAFSLSLAVHALGKPSLDDNTVISQADVRPAGEPKLDPNLHDQLLQALNPTPISLPNPIKNPFIDRAGTAARTTTPQGAASKPGSLNPMGGPGAQAQQQPGAVDADNKPLKSFAERYRDLQKQAAAARQAGRPAPPLTSIYSIKEIEIYGHAQGGGAWIYSKPEERAFTVNAGAQFIDAVFVGFEGDEAVFRTNAGRTIRLQLSRENS